MITFKQYLREDSEDHSIEEAAAVFKKNCSDWSRPDLPLYRLTGNVEGPKRGPSSRSSRTRAERSIAKTADIQDFIFEQPGWEKYPDRSKSTFAYTKDIGHDEKHLYAIYPYNGIKMAVMTKGPDFNLMSIRGSSMSLMDLRNSLEKKLKVYVPGWGGIIDKHDFESMRDLLIKGTKQVKVGSDKTLDFFRDIEKNLTPEAMGMALTTPADFDFAWSRDQHEVWFEGRYLAIPDSGLSEFLKALK